MSSLQDTVPADRIVTLRGAWGIFRKGTSGELLLRLTYKGYVEDEEDDLIKVESGDTDVSDDELSDSDESEASYEAVERDSSNEADKESFMDVLAALIVSEEFQGIVASETGSNKFYNDVSSTTASTISRSRVSNTESSPSDSDDDPGGILFYSIIFVAVGMCYDM